MPEVSISMSSGRANSRALIDTVSKMMRNATKAEKNSFWSLPSLIRFTAAPPKPASPTRLKMLKYARNRKYAPRTDSPTACAKYIVLIKPMRVSAIVVVRDIIL